MNPDSTGGLLLAWFDRNRRDLPWRRSADPYAVWVSEVMLQQTQIERAIPFFESFMARFPDVGRLAAASVDEVLVAWSGLGYYRRARALHAAARQIVAGGGFPCEIGDWLALPGVGAYTSAAVMSIAFGARVPVLDGNVERVLARFSGLEGDPKRVEGRTKLLTLAESLLDEDRPGDSNQALMELGATVCRPRSPRCSQCPLSLSCVAFREGHPEDFPLRRGNKRRVEQCQLAVVVEKEGKTLLIQRPKEADLLAGFWEIPWVPWSERPAAERKLEARYGGRWHLEESRGWVRHSITFRNIRLEVYRGRLSSKPEVAENRNAAWVARAEVERLAVSTLVEKVLRQAD